MAVSDSIVLKIGADVTEIKKALVESEKKLRSFGETAKQVQRYVSGFSASFRDFTVMGIGLGQIKTYLQAVVGQFTTFGDVLDKTCQRTGVLASDLSKLKFAAEQCGGNFESLSVGLRDLYQNLESAEAQAARAANKKRVEDFAAKMSPEELEKSKPLLEKERKENEYYRLLANEKATQAEVEQAKQEKDKAVEEYQKYSVSQSQKKMTAAAEEERKAKGEYERVHGNPETSTEEKARAFDRWQAAQKSSKEARDNWVQQSDQAYQQRFRDAKEAVEIRQSAGGTFSAYEAGGFSSDIATRQLKRLENMDKTLLKIERKENAERSPWA